MICFVIGKGSIGTRHAKNIQKIGLGVLHLSWKEIDLQVLEDMLRKEKNNVSKGRY